MRQEGMTRVLSTSAGLARQLSRNMNGKLSQVTMIHSIVLQKVEVMRLSSNDWAAVDQLE